MKNVISIISLKTLLPRPASWFQCRIKIVFLAAFLAVAAYITLRVLVPLLSTSYSKGPILWFPDRDIAKESFPAERTFHKPSNYIINPSNTCPTGAPIDYLFVVFSAADYSYARNVIRRTWGRDVRTSAGNRLIFVFGKPSTTKLQHTLELESLQYADIVQEDFKDSYRNLTLKTVTMLRWVTLHCPQARFVVKIDDDSFPNLGNLYRAMHGQAEDSIYGHLSHKQRFSRDPRDKWYVSYEEYPSEERPDFITGGMYVIGGRVVNLLYRVTGHVKPFPMEDVYLTGMCAELAGVARFHLVGTHNLKLSSLCEYKKAVYGHHVTADEMIDIWYAMKRLEYKCYRLLFSVHICYCRTARSSAGKEVENALF